MKRSKVMVKDFYIGCKYGCECQKCGKEVHGKQAHMHHKSSRTKKANMANIWGVGEWRKEADKTVLLCEDCHMAFHKKYGKVSTIAKTKEFLSAQA